MGTKFHRAFVSSMDREEMWYEGQVYVVHNGYPLMECVNEDGEDTKPEGSSSMGSPR